MLGMAWVDEGTTHSPSEPSLGTSALAPRDMQIPMVLKPEPCQGAWLEEGWETGPELSLSASQVLRHYDVVLVQEVRDSDLSAVTELMEQLNRYKRGWGWDGSTSRESQAV